MSKFKVQKLRFVNEDESEDISYTITEDFVPNPDLTRFLRSFNSYKTSERYAYSLLKYIRFLEHLNIHYKEVTQSSVIEHYIKHLLGFSGEVIDLESPKTLKSIEYDISVIKSFYEWLEDNGLRTVDQKNPVLYGQKKAKKQGSYGKKHLNKKFLYGQIFEFEVDKRITSKYRFSKTMEHKKWYTPEEINLLLEKLPAVRDKLIFKISIECGCRISEILGIRLEDIYEDETGIFLKIIRRANADNEALVKSADREISITKNLYDDIQYYIRGERAECDIDYSDFLFLNHKGKHKGEPVRRRNFLAILKKTAEKIGLDPKEIRTHSGRSTRAQEIANAMLKHPELGITEEFFRREMGWKSIETAKHYLSDASNEMKAEKINLIEEKRIIKINNLREMD